MKYYELRVFFLLQANAFARFVRFITYEHTKYINK